MFLEIYGISAALACFGAELHINKKKVRRRAMEFLEILKAAVIGIVQGITEWLPVSSTGHMILLNHLIRLDVSEEFWKLFEVIIQLGSILAVVVLYFHKLNPFSPRKTKEEKEGTWRMWLKVIVGSVPVAIAGVLFNDYIPEHPVIIALALIVYGVLFIVIESRGRRPKTNSIEEMSFAKSLGIGAFQALSIIPGTSRSGSTIMGGVILGASREIAAEYSFFLAIPAMAGASLLRIYKYAKEFGLAFSANEIGVLVVGTLVAFVVSVLAIKFLMSFIKKHSFKPFGWYRIALGAVVLLSFLIFR